MSADSNPSLKFHRWLRWAGSIAGGLLSLVVLLGFVGLVYEQIEEIRDRRLNHPPGQLVDVGGYRMHLYCTGQGSPPVILDSGMGDTWLVWRKTQPQLASFAYVCSYDRAGLGWSDPSPQPRNSRIMAQELHTLLHKAGVSGPYVLVGHSLGGFNVLMYANLYPTDVLGMVLVDSAHPDFSTRFSKEFRQFAIDSNRKLDRIADTIPFGIPRLMGWCGAYPLEFQSMARTVGCQVKPFRETHEESAHFYEDEQQVRATASLGNRPLVVVSRDPEKLWWPELPTDVEKEFNQSHEAMQEELPRLSSDSSRVIAKGSGHYIQIERPDVVIEAVHNVVDQCKAQTGPQRRTLVRIAEPKNPTAANPN